MLLMEENMPRRIACLFMSLFIIVLLFSFVFPPLSVGAEKKAKPQQKSGATSSSKDIVVNDANLLSFQKRAEDFFKKGEYTNSLSIALKIHEYAVDVLSATKAIKEQYEKAIGSPSISQNDKEDLIIKSKALEQLISRYSKVREISTFNLGYIYTKLGEKEKARKYLSEYLRMTPFSTSDDSQWMKAKNLLLEVYGLEGEF